MGLGLASLLASVPFASAATNTTFRVGCASDGTVTIGSGQVGGAGVAGAGATVRREPGGMVFLEAAAQPVTLSFLPLLDAVATIPPGGNLRVRLDCGARVFTLRPEASGKTVVLAMADGTRVDLASGASAGIDVMNDGSYVLSGTGGIGVQVAGAERRELRADDPHVTGGPVEKTIGPDGQPRERIRAADTGVVVSGRLGEALVVQVGGRRVELAPGGGAPVELPNGARVFLKNEMGPRRLAWQVEKGLFRFSLSEITGWSCVGVAGDRGELVWDNATRLIDVSNRSVSSPILVRLPGATVARVTPGATFQFGGVNSLTFATAVSGGDAILSGPLISQEISLANNNRLFRAGRVTDVGTPLAAPENFIAVSLEWQGADKVTLRGGGDPVTPEPGGIARLAGSGGAELEARNEGGGSVMITARTGSFVIQPSQLGGATFEVAEGDSLGLRFDPRSRVLTLRAAEANKGSVRALLDTGLEPALTPSTSLTFMFGGARAGSGLGEGGVVFFEAAGAGGVGGAGAAGFAQSTPDPAPASLVTPATQIDVSRISQPPLSPVQ